MTLLWIAIAIAALVLIVGYFVLQRAATGRRYTRQALEQQMEKPPTGRSKPRFWRQTAGFRRTSARTCTS